MEEIHYAPFHEYILVFINGDLAGHFDYDDTKTATRVAQAFNS